MTTRDIDLFVAGVDAVAAGTSNDRAIGELASEERTTDSSGTTTIENVHTLSNVPIKATRRIVVRFEGTMRATGASGLQVLIQEDGVDLVRRNFSVHGSALDQSFSVSKRYTPSAGDHDYQFHTGVSGGGGETATLIADSLSPAIFSVDDLGSV